MTSGNWSESWWTFTSPWHHRLLSSYNRTINPECRCGNVATSQPAEAADCWLFLIRFPHSNCSRSVWSLFVHHLLSVVKLVVHGAACSAVMSAVKGAWLSPALCALCSIRPSWSSCSSPRLPVITTPSSFQFGPSPFTSKGHQISPLPRRHPPVSTSLFTSSQAVRENKTNTLSCLQCVCVCVRTVEVLSLLSSRKDNVSSYTKEK